MTDRTKEFVRVMQVLSPDSASVPIKHLPLSNYARAAQQISDGLTDNEKLVQELAKLVNRKSMLDDPTQDIDKITAIFKKDVKHITTEIDGLEQLLKSSRETQQRQHFIVITNSLRTRMAKCAQQFQKSLHTRTTVLKEQSSRRSRFSHASKSPMVQFSNPLFRRNDAKPQLQTPLSSGKHSPSTPSNDMTRGNAMSEGLNPLQQQQPTSSAPPSLPYPGVSSSGHPALRRRAGPSNPYSNQFAYEQVNQSQQQMQFSSSTSAQDRLNNARQVESTIVELTGMFTKMSTLVAEQGEVISRIDDDMDMAQMNVEAGQNELLKYFKTISGNRSLIIKIFLIILLVIFLFVVVF